MAGGPEGIVSLSNERGSLGLSCTERGLALAGVPLLHRTEHGLRPRPSSEIQWLVSRTYRNRANPAPSPDELNAVARALNAGDTAQATKIACRFKLPELDWDRAVRIANADNTLRKYNQQEPRDWHGRWTSGGSSEGAATVEPLSVPQSPKPLLQYAANGPVTATDAAPASVENSSPTNAAASADKALSESPNSDWVRLPPGERIDEIADLVEWIANAKPEDEREIRREINRKYYDAGDSQDGIALDGFLSQAIRPGRTKQERQDILNLLERYTHHDPVLAGEFSRTLLELGLPELFQGPRALEVPEVAGSEVAAANGLSPVWELGWAERGRRIENAFGRTLAPNFPIIDLIPDGVATSIKSIDLRAATYQNVPHLLRRLNTYVDAVAGFRGAKWGGEDVTPEQITGRALRLLYPRGTMTAEQRAAIAKVRERAEQSGVELNDIPF